MGRVLRVVLLSVGVLAATTAPAAAATFTVTNTGDSAAAGTLRAAITAANATGAADDIAFAIPGGGPHTIGLSADLPAITQPVTIDGYTQAGAAANTDADGSNAVLRIVLDANENRGLIVTGGGSTISGLVIIDAQGPALPVPGTGITQFIGDGVRLDSGGNHVEGNWIGLTAAAAAPATFPDDERNRSAAVRVVSGSGNVIGGTTLAARNVLSGNGDFFGSEGEGGVIVNGGEATVIAGNRIGTNPAGTADLANSQFGVYLNGFSPGGTITNSVVGGTAAGSGNLISGNGNSGVEMVGVGSGNKILGNRIGTNAAGTAALPNLSTGAIRVDDGAVQIGDDQGHGNLVSGNAAYGIYLFGSGHTVQGNRIGTNAAGTAALPNQNTGIEMRSSDTTIGGTSAGAGNLVSGNEGAGIGGGQGGTGNSIQGNFIGTDAAGTGAVPNERGGIVLIDAHEQTVGGTTAAAGNLVSGNAAVGVAFAPGEGGGNGDNVVLSNRIGVDSSGAALANDGPGVLLVDGSDDVVGRPGQGNTIANNAGDGVLVLGQDSVGNDGNEIRGNSLYGNGGLGIDLGGSTSLATDPGDGVTPNDVGDADAGNNQLQNFPVVNASTTGASATISGSLSSKPSTTYTIDVYESTGCDPSGNGEARTPVVSKDVTTNATGTVAWSATGNVPAGRFVTATATDPDGNSSELSACRAAGATTADLSLTFGASNANPAPGSNVTFTTTVANAAGGGGATGVTVDAPLPPGYTFVSASAGVGTYNSGTGVWTIGALAAAGSTQLQVVARVDDGSPNDVFAEVRTSDQGDPDSVPGNRAGGEDDYVVVRVSSAGIWVNHSGTAVSASDGRCTLIEAITAANSDTASGSVARECSPGSGADTIHLQTGETYSLAAANNSSGGGGSPNALPRVTTEMTILGNGSRIRRADGAPDIRLFYVTETGKLRLENATVSHGRSTLGERCGGGLFSGGALTLVDSKVELNVATVGADIAVGGGICQAGGTLTLLRTTVSENTSSANGTAGGAGIYAFNAVVTIADSDIRQNLVQANSSTGRGGGVYSQGGSLAMTGTTVRGNIVTGGPGSTVRYGGGLYLTASTATLTDTMVGGSIAALGNQAFAGGGIALEGAGAKLTMTRGALQENVANGVFNTAGGGGGIANGTGGSAGGEVTLNEVGVIANHAPNADGGGIFNRGVLNMIDGSISSNTSLSGGGMSNGSGVFTGGAAALGDVTLSGNRATNVGGSVYVPSGTTSLANTTVENGRATTGGGVYVDAFGFFTLTDSTITRSTATGGGNLAVVGALSKAVLANSTLSNGDAGLTGGGALVAWGGTLEVTGGKIEDNIARGSNVADGGGGGIASGGKLSAASILADGGNVTLTDVALPGNRSPAGDGGGIFNRGTLKVARGSITDNDALNGGGIGNGTGAISGGAVVLTGSTITGNGAGFSGGGISSTGRPGSPAQVNVTDTSIDSNQAVAWGGGVGNWQDSRLVTVRSAITRNDAGGGGGLFNAGRVDIDNTTVSGNSALGNGGGILSELGTVAVRSSTITDNSASFGGAYTYYTVGSFTNSIVAGNHSPTYECTGPIVSSRGNNLVSDESYCPRGGSGDQRIETTAVATEVLEPLASGGGGGLSHRLRPGSPARDAGPLSGSDPDNACSLGPDQTGAARFVDGDGDATLRCDTGAVEAQSAPAAPLRLHRLVTARAVAGAGPLVFNVRGAGFDGGSVVRWNGAPLPTTFVSPVELSAQLSAADLAAGPLVRTAAVTVTAPDGTTTRPLPFTVTAPSVAAVESSTVTGGGHASASSLSASPGVLTDLHTSGPHTATVTAATYSSNPVGGTVFSAGGFMDLQVTGAQPSDRLDALFFYPSTITGASEAALTLRYWTGSAWAPVLGNGGGAPGKVTDDNYGGTVSGGRFIVTFSDTSTPKVTELSGTVIAWTEDLPGAADPPGPSGPGPVFPADTTPPEAALSFDSAKRDVVVRDRTAVRGAAVKPTKSTKPKKGKSRRTYTLRDAAGNALTMVVELKTSRSAMTAKVVSLKYGSGRTKAAAKNSVAYKWTLKKRRVSKLTQTMVVGKRKVIAKYDRAKNRTTITDKTKRRRPLTKRGLAPVRLETAAGVLAVSY